MDLPLAHVLSFEATPEWIRNNFERVTHRVGLLKLHGWRVPYYRSGREDDFAGSITYYFDRSRRVQRIQLHGYTSDASEFVQLATTHYQMIRVQSTEGDLFVAVIEGQSIGGLHLVYAPLLDTKRPSKQCEVLLELNRKRSEHGMSKDFKRMLSETRDANILLAPVLPAPALDAAATAP